MKLFIDIETIPGQSTWVREEVESTVSHPANMSKPETIEKWEQEKKAGVVDEKWKKTGLDGTLGEVWCIGMAVDDQDPVVIARDYPNGYSFPEDGLLSEWMVALKDFSRDKNGNHRNPIWIGHYITGFDLRFLWQRCVINKVKPTVRIPYDAKPWDDKVFDTCIEWAGLQKQGSSSLDVLSKAMGLEGKDMDGSQVWDLVKSGEYQKVIDYCRADVEKTRELYKRMTFSD